MVKSWCIKNRLMWWQHFCWFALICLSCKMAEFTVDEKNICELLIVTVCRSLVYALYFNSDYKTKCAFTLVLWMLEKIYKRPCQISTLVSKKKK